MKLIFLFENEWEDIINFPLTSKENHIYCIYIKEPNVISPLYHRYYLHKDWFSGYNIMSTRYTKFIQKKL